MKKTSSMSKYMALFAASGWAVGLTYFSASMHFRHLFGFKLNEPEKVLSLYVSTASEPTPGSESLSLNREPQRAQRAVTHILGVDCGCSEVIYKALITESKLDQNEMLQTVVLFPSVKDQSRTTTWVQELTKVGYVVKTVSDIEAIPVTAVPGLIVSTRAQDQAANAQKILYSGGYTERRVSDPARVELQSLLTQVFNGDPVPSRPSFGCAIASSLQNKLKPELALNRFISQLVQKD